MAKKRLTFDVSSGLKRVLGRELITDDEVAIFELVKNSFDAGADHVQLFFGDDSILISDNGSGMTYEDLTLKWLFVAYSAKRAENLDDFREKVAERSHFAGSKGIGRFSSDRLGEELVLQTRPKVKKSGPVHRLTIDWSKFDSDDKKHFERIPVAYSEATHFEFPRELSDYSRHYKFGTVIEVRRLNLKWKRGDLQNLKASLAKLINPFGSDVDRFQIDICAPAEQELDDQNIQEAKTKGEEVVARSVVNGRVGNFIFEDLQEKTTFIEVKVEGDKVESTLTDRGELIYRIREPNPYPELGDSGFQAEVYYLNHSAKLTFARRVGLPSVQFGSVFLFRNGFRVYPIGEDGDDWFGIARRKQQGYSRYLGTREVIGRVDVFGTDEDFQESSSRNQGLIDTPAVQQLKKCVMDHCVKRLERYVVPVSWVDKAEAHSEDISRLLTDPGISRVSAAVANLVDNDSVELIDYSKRLVSILNERSEAFESSVVSLRLIAEKTDDNELISKLNAAERRFEELKKAEAEARRIADQERAATAAATERAQKAEASVEVAKAEADVERRRAHFLESVVDLDVSTILNLHHQVTIYSVDVSQQIENIIAETEGRESIPREDVLRALEQMAFLNRKIQAVTRFAAQAKFQLESETITADIAGFIVDYIEKIAGRSGSARLQIKCSNDDARLEMTFNPIDVSIVVDNLVSNARRARATRIDFTLDPLGKHGIQVQVRDNGRGLIPGADPGRIFEMGYTTTNGSGLGLYHVRRVLGQLNGSIELTDSKSQSGTTFIIKIAKGKSKK